MRPTYNEYVYISTCILYALRVMYIYIYIYDIMHICWWDRALCYACFHRRLIGRLNMPTLPALCVRIG